MTIVTPYNHTTALFLSGQLDEGDDYRINLYTVLPENPTAVTKAAAESGATQLATAFGYTQNAKVITGWTVSTINTNEAKIDSPDPTWTASGGSLVGDFGMIWNNTKDLPVFRVDFEGTITATDGVPFVVQWDANGIYALSYAP